VARKGSPARLVVALSIAAVLAVFLLYTSIAGGGTPAVAPSELASYTGIVSLGGQVVGRPNGDPHGEGLRFVLKDIAGDAPDRVTVLYRGSVPDQFRTGRDLVVEGELRGGVFVAEPGSMVTKCPSKYAPASASS
jgi:cytochrome c-type biogenesis protein CcmE